MFFKMCRSKMISVWLECCKQWISLTDGRKTQKSSIFRGAEGQSLVSWITHAAVYTQRWEEGTVWENIWLQACNLYCSHSVSLTISLALSDVCKIQLFKEINYWKHNTYPRSHSSSLPSLITKSPFLSEFCFLSLALFSTLNFSLPSYICCGAL